MIRFLSNADHSSFVSSSDKAVISLDAGGLITMSAFTIVPGSYSRRQWGGEARSAQLWLVLLKILFWETTELSSL